MRKALKIFTSILALALYLNTGWALGTYMGNNVSYSTELNSPAAKFLAGPLKFANHPERSLNLRDSILSHQIFFSLTWPLLLGVISFVWLTYFLVCYLLWLIFAGGLAELTSGQACGIFLVILGMWCFLPYFLGFLRHR